MRKLTREQITNTGLLALRIVVGIVFIRHGWMKIQDIEPVVQMLGNIGFPLPIFFAWLLALVEFLGGLAVLLGVYLRCAAKLLAIDMVLALLLVHTKMSFGQAELPLVLLGASIALYALGGGAWMLTKKDCTCKMCTAQ